MELSIGLATHAILNYRIDWPGLNSQDSRRSPELIFGLISGYGSMRSKSVPDPNNPVLCQGTKIGGTRDMPFERYVMIFLSAVCVLEGLVFIEVRRLRKFMEKK